MYTNKFFVFYKSALNPSFEDMKHISSTQYAKANTPEQHQKWLDKYMQDHMLSFFVSAHDEGSKAFDKRMETANNWSSVDSSNPYMEQKKAEVQNVPTKGFKFINTTRRYSTSNVLFRIEHPQGYIFEISAENALEIIENCTIVEGTIQDELFFDNHKYLLNNKSQKYQALIDFNKKSEDAKGLVLGTSCVMKINEYYSSTPEKEYNVQYLGKMHCIALGENKSTIQHAFRDFNDKILFCTESNIKLNFVKFSDFKFEVLPENVYHLIQTQIHNRNVFDNHFKQSSKYGSDVVWVQKSPFNNTDLEEVYRVLSKDDLTRDNKFFDRHVKPIYKNDKKLYCIEMCTDGSAYMSPYNGVMSWPEYYRFSYNRLKAEEFTKALNDGNILHCNYIFTKNFRSN